MDARPPACLRHIPSHLRLPLLVWCLYLAAVLHMKATLVGNYFWDYIALIGLGNDITSGHDTWIPFYLDPVMLKLLADWFGFDRAFYLSCLIFSVIAYLVTLSATRVGFSRSWRSLLLLIVVMLSLFPVSDQSFRFADAINFEGIYNRRGDILLLCGTLLVLQAQWGRTFHALVVALLAYFYLSKFSYFHAFFMIAGTHLALHRRGRSLLLVCACYVSAMLLASATGYLQTLLDILEVRGGHRSTFYLFMALIIINPVMGYIAMARLPEAWREPSGWLWFAVVAIVALDIAGAANAIGGYPELRLLAGALVIYRALEAWNIREISLGFERSGKPSSLSIRSRLFMAGAAYKLIFAMKCALLLFATLMLASGGDGVYQPLSLRMNSIREHTETPMTKDWQYLYYLEARHLAQWLRQRPERRVVMFSFAAAVPEALAGKERPAGARPWYLYGKEISDSHHPDYARIVADAELVVMDYCDFGNQGQLNRQVAPHVAGFEVLYRNECHVVLRHPSGTQAGSHQAAI